MAVNAAQLTLEMCTGMMLSVNGVCESC